MASLSDDVNHCLVPYLSDRDLCNYRLPSRNLARIRAKERFLFIAFHASERSVQRLLDISHAEHIRKCVKALVWDSNLSDIGIEDVRGGGAIFLKSIQTIYSTGTINGSVSNLGLHCQNVIEMKLSRIFASGNTLNTWNDSKTKSQYCVVACCIRTCLLS